MKLVYAPHKVRFALLMRVSRSLLQKGVSQEDYRAWLHRPARRIPR